MSSLVRYPLPHQPQPAGPNSRIVQPPAAAPAAADIPYRAPQQAFTRDPSEIPWNQKDRRNAHLVATPANPLVPPLDSAWQAGSKYWHLYNDRNNFAGPSFVQRVYSSDSALLLLANDADPVTLTDARVRELAPAAFVDRRSMPQQKPKQYDQSVAAAANFDPTLAGYGWVAELMPATHQDRRDYPQQRIPIQNPDDVMIVGTGATMGWWGVDDTAAYLWHALPPGLEPNMLTAPVFTNPELSAWLPTWLSENRAATHVDRRLMPQYTLRKSAYGLLDIALLENELLGGADDTGRHRGWFKRPWFGLQRAALIDQSVAAIVDFDPTLAGYGPRWLWRRDPYAPQQRQLESPTGMLDTALLEVPPPLPITYGLATTHQRLPWLRIKQIQYDQSAAAIITDFDPTLGGGYGPEWRRWYRPPVAPMQRERESDPNLLTAALLENELLGDADDTVRHRGWFARPWFGLQRTALIDQSVVSTIFDPTQAGYGPRWMWYRAPVAPQQRPLKSDPNLLLTALLENQLLGGADDLVRHRAWSARPWFGLQRAALADQSQASADPTLAGYGPRWMWYRPLVAPVQRDRESDPTLLPALMEDPFSAAADDLNRHRSWYTDRRLVPQQRDRRSDPRLLLTALLEDPILGGWDDLIRHRMWHTDRREVPQQRSYPDALIPEADPLIVVGADWRRRLTPATHAPRWMLRLQIQYLRFVGTAAPPGARRPALFIQPNQATLYIQPNGAILYIPPNEATLFFDT